MKKFKFQYSPIVWVLLSIILIFCLGGLLWNVFNLAEYFWAGTAKIISYSLLILACLFLVVFVLSVMFYGNYVIKKECLYTCFGLIHTKVDIKDVVQIIHFKKSNKLVVYFSDQKYSVIVISPAKYDEFVLELRQQNPLIVFDAEIDGEDLPK